MLQQFCIFRIKDKSESDMTIFICDPLLHSTLYIVGMSYLEPFLIKLICELIDIDVTFLFCNLINLSPVF